jgi:hypothetical protein
MLATATTSRFLPTKPPQKHGSGSTIQRASPSSIRQSKQSRRWGLISGGFSLRMMSSLTHESRWLTRIVNRQFVALSSASGPRTQRE